MRDAIFKATKGAGFNYNLPIFALEKKTWEKKVENNNCYNFGTGRHNSKGKGAFPGQAGGYNNKYADVETQIIEGVLADGAIFLGFDGKNERYGKNMPNIKGFAGKVFLMASTGQEGGEYHFFRLFKNGWYQKDGNKKKVTQFKVGGKNIPQLKSEFKIFFCDEKHKIPIGYFLILPTHKVDGTIDKNFGGYKI